MDVNVNINQNKNRQVFIHAKNQQKLNEIISKKYFKNIEAYIGSRCTYDL
jgi:hypothetical protein